MKKIHIYIKIFLEVILVILTNGMRNTLKLKEIKITSKSNFLVTEVINYLLLFLSVINYIIRSRADNPIFENRST